MITESWNGLDWKGPQRWSSSNLPLDQIAQSPIQPHLEGMDMKLYESEDMLDHWNVDFPKLQTIAPFPILQSLLVQQLLIESETETKKIGHWILHKLETNLLFQLWIKQSEKLFIKNFHKNWKNCSDEEMIV